MFVDKLLASHQRVAYLMATCESSEINGVPGWGKTKTSFCTATENLMTDICQWIKSKGKFVEQKWHTAKVPEKKFYMTFSTCAMFLN